MATLAQRLQAEIDRANGTTSKADTTVHNAIGSLIDGYGQGGIEKVAWHQCSEAVQNYLDNVSYDSNDYTTSQIADYAPATAVQSSTKPIGKTVDGVTYYNEVPNIETPFASANVAGTVKPLDRLRWINSVTSNMRDLGGWYCDGGTVKYGMLFRGGEPSVSDKSLMVDKIGIKHELQLRGKNEAPQQYSIWGIDFTCPETYVWMSLSNTAAWKKILRCVFDTVPYNLPLYFHCAAGADRTGTVAVMLEALLGMSQSDIDKDYELTCFSTGTGSEAQARRRDEDEYKNYIAAIKAVSIPEGVEDTFRNHAIYFVASLGFTADEINAYRSAMIDGNPEAITLSLGSFTVTKSGSNITFDNNISCVNEYQEYEVNLSPNDGYAIDSIQVTMGGVNITSSVVTGDKTTINCSISNLLTKCTSENIKAIAIKGQGYVEDIDADSGYKFDTNSVVVTMGGVDITSQVLTLFE